MRVLHELNQLDYGGAERVVLNIAAAPRGEDEEHIVYAWQDGLMRLEFERAGVELHVGETVLPFPDVLHIHTGGDTSRLVDALAARGAFSPGALRPRIVETLHAPLPSRVPTEFVDARVATGEGMRELTGHGVTDVIHNGVDFNRLHPIATRREARRRLSIPGGFVIGWVGRVCEEKSPLDLVAAANLLAAHDDVYLVLVGPCAEDLRAMLQAAASARLTLIFAPPSNPGLVMPAFDTFACASIVEACPLVRVEAMSLGVPCAWRGDPVGEEFGQDGRTAVLARTPDVADLAAAIRRAHRDRALLEGPARDFACHFTVPRMVEKYRAVYARVTG